MKILANTIMGSGGIICPVRIKDCDTVKNRGISNPSIVNHNGKKLITFRSCDYTFFASVKPNLSHHILVWYPIDRPNAHTHLNSRNVICEFDDDCNVLNPKQYLTEHGYDKFNGYEDIRLSSFDGVLYASASHPTKNGIPMRICKLDDNFELVSFDEYSSGSPEKNWMPVMDKKGVYYYLAPERVIAVENGNVTDIRNVHCEDRFSGSSQLVPYNLDGTDGYVCVIHRGTIESYNDKGNYILNYLHKFLFFDRDYNLVHQSDWFRFTGFPIEYTCGLMIEDGIVTLPFSIMDSYSFISKFSTNVLDDLLLWKNHKFYNDNPNDISGELGDLRFKLGRMIMDEDSTNYAAKIAVSTYLATMSKSNKEAINMYEYALGVLGSFDSNQENKYFHSLLFQDHAINQIKYLKEK